VEDRALHKLFKRHQRLLGEFLRAFHGNQPCGGVLDELMVVDGVIRAELAGRGYQQECSDVKASYDDPNSIFVQIYAHLDAQFSIKT